MKYGPYVCIGIVLAILFVLWAFWGGKNYEFVGLSPLDPSTCMSYTGSIYQWGEQVTPASNIPIPPPEILVCEQNPIEEPLICENPELPIVTDIPEAIPLANIPNIVNVPPAAPKRRGRFVSRGERMCCETMERIYGVPFTTVRPNWLKNPETGLNLELDCYNDELKLAVEYNGIQHYKFPNFTNQSYDQFINQIRRDKLKAELCERNGVYLIVVPYSVDHDKISSYIISQLPESIQERIKNENLLQ